MEVPKGGFRRSPDRWRKTSFHRHAQGPRVDVGLHGKQELAGSTPVLGSIQVSWTIAVATIRVAVEEAQGCIGQTAGLSQVP